MQMHTFHEHESNYTVIKLRCNETVRQNKLTNQNLVYRRYQTQLMGWIHLIIFTQIIYSWMDTNNAGRMTFLAFSKRIGFWT